MSAVAPDLVGLRIGGYRILALLGEGGMGAVYEAEQEQIGRAAAIKVLHAHLALEPGAAQRFLDEARATNRVRHPGIVDIYDSGRAPEVGTYLVMELLRGESFAARLARAPRPSFAEVARVVDEIAAALAAAHAAGIVHRDLKPANVFLHRDPRAPDGWCVKLLDFGIAKLQGGDATGQRTATGAIVGTPVYMSPEQCAGARAVDHRADQYALAVLTYEALAGRPPFVAPGYGELIALHLGTDPPPLRAQRADVSERLEQAIGRALAKEPDARFPDVLSFAREVAAALRAHAASTPALALEETIASPPRTPPRGATVSGFPRAGAPDAPIALAPATPPAAPAAAAAPRFSARVVAAAATAVVALAAVLFWSALSRSGRPPGAGPTAPADPAATATSTATSTSTPAPTPAAPATPSALAPAPGAGIAPGTAAAASTTAPTGAALTERRLTFFADELGPPSFVLTPDGASFFAATQSDLWRGAVAGGEPASVLHFPATGYNILGVFPDGARLLATRRDAGSALVALALPAGAPETLLDGVITAALSPDGRTIAAAVDHDGLSLLDVATRAARPLLATPPTDTIRALAWSPDGARLALVRDSGGASATLELLRRDGSRLVTLLSDRALISFSYTCAVVFAGPDRLLYVIDHAHDPGGGAELWEQRLDAAGAAGPARLVRVWPGASLADVRWDRGRLFYVVFQEQQDVYVAPLSRSLGAGTPVRLTKHDAHDWLTAWAGPDAVLFASTRSGDIDLFAQKLSAGDATLVAGGPGAEEGGVLAPDGALVFLRRAPGAGEAGAGARTLFRRSAAGAEQALFDLDLGTGPGVWSGVRCAPKRCVLSGTREGGIVFLTFDPVTGARAAPFHVEVRSFPNGVPWDLSPDGARLAILGVDHRLALVPVDGGPAKSVTLATAAKLQRIRFGHDGTYLLASGTGVGAWPSALLRFDLAGKATVLYGEDGAWLSTPIAAPDGKHVAFGRLIWSSDCYVLDGLD
ncbi:MAG TPA: protein kinase [Myxococcota bacterium]|jgi:serine/threonine-protein kinase|nr:protein kinase [Myxococcota bacterium]